MLNLVKTVMRRHNILWSGRKEPPMHYGRRSDLALEAKELFESSAGKTTQLSGVRAREETLFGYPLTRVDILDCFAPPARWRLYWASCPVYRTPALFSWRAWATGK